MEHMGQHHHRLTTAFHQNRPFLVIPYDGFTWLKYGQKLLHSTKLTRAYFKCVQHTAECKARKFVDFNQARPNETPVITYSAQHNHPPYFEVPPPPPDTAETPSSAQGPDLQGPGADEGRGVGANNAQATPGAPTVEQAAGGQGERPPRELVQEGNTNTTTATHAGPWDCDTRQGVEACYAQELKPETEQCVKRRKRDSPDDVGLFPDKRFAAKTDLKFETLSEDWSDYPDPGPHSLHPGNGAPFAGPDWPPELQAAARVQLPAHGLPSSQVHYSEVAASERKGPSRSGTWVAGPARGAVVGESLLQGGHCGRQEIDRARTMQHLQLPSPSGSGLHQSAMGDHIRGYTSFSPTFQPDLETASMQGRCRPPGQPASGQHRATPQQHFPQAQMFPSQVHSSQGEPQGMYQVPYFAEPPGSAMHQPPRKPPDQPVHMPFLASPTGGFQPRYSSASHAGASSTGGFQPSFSSSTGEFQPSFSSASHAGASPTGGFQPSFSSASPSDASPIGGFQQSFSSASYAGAHSTGAFQPSFSGVWHAGASSIGAIQRSVSSSAGGFQQRFSSASQGGAQRAAVLPPSGESGANSTSSQVIEDLFTEWMQESDKFN